MPIRSLDGCFHRWWAGITFEQFSKNYHMDTDAPNVVSHEIAVKLKEAGFPQPTLESEQYWYDENGLALILETEDGGFVECDPMWEDIRVPFDPAATGKMSFAPDADYIINLLPPNYADLKLQPVFNTFEKSGKAVRIALDPNEYAQMWLDENTKSSK